MYGLSLSLSLALPLCLNSFEIGFCFCHCIAYNAHLFSYGFCTFELKPIRSILFAFTLCQKVRIKNDKTILFGKSFSFFFVLFCLCEYNCTSWEPTLSGHRNLQYSGSVHFDERKNSFSNLHVLSKSASDCFTYVVVSKICRDVTDSFFPSTWFISGQYSEAKSLSTLLKRTKFP